MNATVIRLPAFKLDAQGVLIYRNTEAWWVDCPVHGPQPPLTELDGYWGLRPVTWALLAQCYCPAEHDRDATGLGDLDQRRDPVLLGYGMPLTVRKARLVERPPGRPRDKCDDRCLNGKRECSCRCKGRCHGYGTCVCGGDR